MTFKQQLILMVVDKLVIAGLIALIVLWGQKRLEAFRNEQALQKEIAKARVDSLAAGWKALNAWDFAVTRLISRFAVLLRQRLDLRDEAGVDELGLPDVVEIAGWLSTRVAANASLIAEMKMDCDRELQPLIENSLECSHKAKEIMQENRFWFGKELYDHCAHFHAALHQVCNSFEKRDFQALPDHLKLLEKKRQNVLIVLQSVRSLPQHDLND